MTRDQAIEEAGQALAEAIAELQRNGIELVEASPVEVSAKARPRRSHKKAA